MEGVSVIIPSRKERYLKKTVEDVLEKADEEIEVIVVIDNPSMREAINIGVEQAKYKYIMKLDAHCMLGNRFDYYLKKCHLPSRVQIPVRKRLIVAQWKVDQEFEVNRMYIGKNYMGIRNRSQKVFGEICETEIFQGSCYFMEKEFFKRCGLLDDDNFGGSGFEALEIVTKVRFHGGDVIRNLLTWYAHARVGRKYVSDRSKSRRYINKFLEKYA